MSIAGFVAIGWLVSGVIIAVCFANLVFPRKLTVWRWYHWLVLGGIVAVAPVSVILAVIVLLWAAYDYMTAEPRL